MNDEQQTLQKVKDRLDELNQQITSLIRERERLKAYVAVHRRFSNPPLRHISGKEIDVLVHKLLLKTGRPLSTSEIVNGLRDQHRVEVAASRPARLVSTRLSVHSAVMSTEQGWSLHAPNETESRPYDGE